jgi:hypothetical protein
MAYKNVHRRIKKLHSLHLIEAIEGETKHSAIYYRLSTGGLYYLIYKHRRFLIRALKKILQNYADNIIFNTLLYPYIERDTILQMTLANIISKICKYLHDCCEQTESAIESIDKNIGQLFPGELFIWQHVPGDHNNKLLQFLKRVFRLDWSENVKIRKIEHGNAIKLSYNQYSLLIKLDDRKTRATLTINGGYLDELAVEKLTSGKLALKVTDQNATEFAEQTFSNGIKSFHVPTLAFDVVSTAIPDLSDYKILSQDTKFMQLVEETKRIFDNNYNKLIDVRMSS